MPWGRFRPGARVNPSDPNSRERGAPRGHGRASAGTSQGHLQQPRPARWTRTAGHVLVGRNGSPLRQSETTSGGSQGTPDARVSPGGVSRQSVSWFPVPLPAPKWVPLGKDPWEPLRTPWYVLPPRHTSAALSPHSRVLSFRGCLAARRPPGDPWRPVPRGP